MDPYSWGWDAQMLVLVPVLTVGYLAAVRAHPAPRWRVACFLAGQILLLAAFITPLETLALEYLLTAHLLQNVVVAEWAPALIVLGLPRSLAAELTRGRVLRTLTRPVLALPLWLLTYYAWHVPAAYDAALRNPALLHVEHACYLAAGLLFWWPALQDEPWRVSNAGRAAYVFAAFVLASPLGLLLALLPDPVYAFYEDAPRLWGLSALEDQQFAGITMSIEEAIVFSAAFSVFLLRFLGEQE